MCVSLKSMSSDKKPHVSSMKTEEMCTVVGRRPGRGGREGGKPRGGSQRKQARGREARGWKPGGWKLGGGGSQDKEAIQWREVD